MVLFCLSYPNFHLANMNDSSPPDSSQHDSSAQTLNQNKSYTGPKLTTKFVTGFLYNMLTFEFPTAYLVAFIILNFIFMFVLKCILLVHLNYSTFFCNTELRQTPILLYLLCYFAFSLQFLLVDL